MIDVEIKKYAKKITKNKIEAFARMLHESEREGVEKKIVLYQKTYRKFMEWEQLTESMKEGYRIQAGYLMKHFNFTVIL